MGPRLNVWICANTTVFLAPILQDSMGPRPHLWMWACKTDTLGPE